ncbi:MAG: hypothetical protein HY752_02990 [Nitrospirae bacterium]|nr:hypothetical protein [Nitrospirota bacterium]
MNEPLGMAIGNSLLGKFKEMVELQSGNPEIAEKKTLLPYSCLSIDIYSPKEGYIQSRQKFQGGIKPRRNYCKI